MKTTLIILNVVAAVLVLPAMQATHHFYTMNAVNLYVALDRNQILNRDKLEKIYPDKIKNDRILIPKSHMANFPVKWIGIACIMAFVMNAFLIAFMWKPIKQKQ